jgi:hypothetical protein
VTRTAVNHWSVQNLAMAMAMALAMALALAMAKKVVKHGN